ncbi:hypothetical protein QYE76_011448 [Lolium multiflorum]|uniref:CCHC-type domain-containing protein n=1 Tax=Lolium multiflorum TaxID=4521 RepID=A0AAD8TWY4_LOLMU|nr:hypothetical protein QYE76_011448 [Lolium multiflorum]
MARFKLALDWCQPALARVSPPAVRPEVWFGPAGSALVRSTGGGPVSRAAPAAAPPDDGDCSPKYRARHRLQPPLPTALARLLHRRHHQSAFRAEPPPVDPSADTRSRRTAAVVDARAAAPPESTIVEEIKVVLVIAVFVRVALIKESDTQILLMGTFTKLWVPYPEDDTPFSDTLSRIETTIEGRLVQPATDTVVYLKTYPDWEDGVVMAMQEALARIVYRYRNDIDEDSDIQHFGHRSSAGFCIRTKGNCEGMTWTAIQFEDMERYAQKMEHHLRLEMKDCDLIKQILQENNLKYYEMKEQRDELDAEVVQLKTDNEKLQDETFKQQAIILALQAHKDLVTCECTEAEKIRFTAHLLEGPAAMWWETYQLTHPLDDLDWETFKEGFCTAHISSGIMNLKRDKFRSLRQGGRTLKEYMDDFCALERYAPEDIDTDVKRKEKFLNGLKGELKIPLSVDYAPNYQSLLDQAITLDNNINKEENRKRKFSNSKNHSEPFHKKHHSSEGSVSHNSHNHNGHFGKGNGNNYNGHRHNEGFKGDHYNSHPNGNNGHHNGNNGQHHPNSGDNRDLSNITCYKCKKTGHFAKRCPENKPQEVTKPNPFQKGQVNHLHVEEVTNEPYAVMVIPGIALYTGILPLLKGRVLQFATIRSLDVLVSEVDQPLQPPLPRYATDIMSSDLTGERPYNGRSRTPPRNRRLRLDLHHRRGLLHLYLHRRWHRRMFRCLPTGRGRYRIS